MSKEIEEIEKRQKEIAELYVQLTNTGELIKREIKYSRNMGFFAF